MAAEFGDPTPPFFCTRYAVRFERIQGFYRKTSPGIDFFIAI